MTSAAIERRLMDRAARVASLAVDAAVSARVDPFVAAPLVGVVVAAGPGTTAGEATLTLTGARLRQRYVGDADLRRLIRERLL